MKKNILILCILVVGALSALCLILYNNYVGVKEGDVIKEPEVEDVSDLIKVVEPMLGGVVSSPLTVRGEARGHWYFEATFPVALVDESGNTIVEYYAQAQDEWMTESFVPFETILTFSPQPEGSKGFLVLKKDNPSGLPEHDKELRIPVIFK